MHGEKAGEVWARDACLGGAKNRNNIYVELALRELLRT